MGTAAIGFILPIRWLERLPEFLGEEFVGLSQVLILLAPCVGALLTAFVFWIFPTNFRGHGVTRVALAVGRPWLRVVVNGRPIDGTWQAARSPVLDEPVPVQLDLRHACFFEPLTGQRVA